MAWTPLINSPSRPVKRLVISRLDCQRDLIRAERALITRILAMVGAMATRVSIG